MNIRQFYWNNQKENVLVRGNDLIGKRDEHNSFAYTFKFKMLSNWAGVMEFGSSNKLENLSMNNK